MFKQVVCVRNYLGEFVYEIFVLRDYDVNYNQILWIAVYKKMNILIQIAST